ncbi:hypothetical protein [Altererythrobacter sp. Z27]|uniref:hypothetical protein n=1 Tax=Altererythrobacter sp. Z27 TaxID=3461147 RepID=UPI0040448E0A
MIWAQAVAIAPAESAEIEVTATESRVGYEALMAGDNLRAIAEIEANRSLAANDPVRLINLGIAYARQGDEARARSLFEGAVASSDQMELETATGDWVYSRALARQALRMLDGGDLHMARMAAR